MKKMRNVYAAISALMLALMTSGCNGVSSFGYNPFPNIFIKEEAHLTEDASSPFCDFSLDYTCLNEKDDSIAGVINRTIQAEFLGEDYTSLVPEVAVDSFKNVYLRNYRKEVGELYMADLDKSSSRDAVPNWYAQTYSLVTFVEEGRGGTVNATANYFVDMGGAHPNQWSRWMNFDFSTGALLSKEEVFLPESTKEIETILLNKLLLHQSEIYPDETIQTLEDLHNKGILQLTNMYIPDNFLLGKDKIQFLFNRYDIAPYSAGEIVLEVPYEEMGHCLKNM